MFHNTFHGFSGRLHIWPVSGDISPLPALSLSINLFLDTFISQTQPCSTFYLHSYNKPHLIIKQSHQITAFVITIVQLAGFKYPHKIKGITGMHSSAPPLENLLGQMTLAAAEESSTFSLFSHWAAAVVLRLDCCCLHAV